MLTTGTSSRYVDPDAPQSCANPPHDVLFDWSERSEAFYNDPSIKWLCDAEHAVDPYYDVDAMERKYNS